MSRSYYAILYGESTPGILVIRDVGGNSGYMSVTNDAETVVEELVSGGHLTPGRRLLYYDTDNALSELVVEDGKFKGFKDL